MSNWRAVDGINRYPDNGYVELKERLAKHVDFAQEHISVGCGSVSLCQQLIQITASVGDEVMFGWRSFEIYPLQVRTAGATPVQVPLTDHAFDLDAMLAAVTDRTRLIFICNPNNPTSTVVDPDALARFVAAVPPDILIVLDEAYVEYIRDEWVPDSFGLVRAHSNVVVLRTFSKAYGLAGLRVGYAVGDPEVIRKWVNWQRRQWDRSHSASQKVIKMRAYIDVNPIEPIDIDVDPASIPPRGPHLVYVWPEAG